jgi:hypothetical protein
MWLHDDPVTLFGAEVNRTGEAMFLALTWHMHYRKQDGRLLISVQRLDWQFLTRSTPAGSRCRWQCDPAPSPQLPDRRGRHTDRLQLRATLGAVDGEVQQVHGIPGGGPPDSSLVLVVGLGLALRSLAGA